MKERKGRIFYLMASLLLDENEASNKLVVCSSSSKVEKQYNLPIKNWWGINVFHLYPTVYVRFLC